MKKSRNLPKPSSKALENFLEQVKRTPTRNEREAAGRLVFGMDATASRERTWDNACQIQNQMFIATDDIGGINIQLCYYRGFNQFQYSGCQKTRLSVKKDIFWYINRFIYGVYRGVFRRT